MSLQVVMELQTAFLAPTVPQLLQFHFSHLTPKRPRELSDPWVPGREVGKPRSELETLPCHPLSMIFDSVPFADAHLPACTAVPTQVVFMIRKSTLRLRRKTAQLKYGPGAFKYKLIYMLRMSICRPGLCECPWTFAPARKGHCLVCKQISGANGLLRQTAFLGVALNLVRLAKEMHGLG